MKQKWFAIYIDSKNKKSIQEYNCINKLENANGKLKEDYKYKFDYYYLLGRAYYNDNKLFNALESLKKTRRIGVQNNVVMII